MAGAADPVRGMDGCVAAAGDDHPHQSGFDRRPFDFFQLVTLDVEVQLPIGLELERPRGVGDRYARHQVVLRIDGPRAAGSAGGTDIQRLGLGDHKLAPGAFEFRSAWDEPRGGNHKARAGRQILHRRLPTEFDGVRAQQFGFARKGPCDIALLRRRIRVGERPFAVGGRIVVDAGGERFGDVDSQRFHAAVADVVEQGRLVLCGARFKPRDHKLLHG